MDAPNNNTGLRRFSNAFTFSIQGFRAAFRSEEAFRQEVFVALAMIPLGLWIGESGVERALMIGSVVMVLIVEILNTAIERAIDRISLEKHDLSKEAKDMGSTAVFLMLVTTGVVWALIILPKIF